MAVAEYGDQIWVAGGTYRFRNTTDRRSSFNLKNGVQLYGGVSGVETRLEQRDWTRYVTTLSGEIGQPGRADNVYHVVYGKGLDANTVLDGFSVTGAYYVSPFELPAFNNGGGGIMLLGENGMRSQPLIRNCRIFQNASNYGGGIYISDRDLRFPDSTGGRISPRIEACIIERNYASMDGGGIYVTKDSDPSDTFYVLKSIFRFNRARFGSGGGISLQKTDYMRLWVEGCRFERDSAIDGASIFYLDGTRTGYSLNFYLKNTTFTRNYAIEGGAFLYRESQGVLTNTNDIYISIENCLMESNFPNESAGVSVYKFKGGKVVFIADQLVARKNGNTSVLYIFAYPRNQVSSRLENCVFEENEGVAFAYTGDEGNIAENRINNCLFIQNGMGISSGKVGPSDNMRTPTTITNCVFYHNTYEFSKYFSPSYLGDTTIYNKMYFENCIIEHANDSIYEFFANNPRETHVHQYFFRNTSLNLSVKPNLPGNTPATFPTSVIFGTDPEFLDAQARNFRLLPCSPLIGKGDNRYVHEAGIGIDLDKKPRILFKNVDLGAYEQSDSCGVSGESPAAFIPNFSVFPAPSSNGVFHWQVPGSQITPESLLIVDVTGRIVFKQSLHEGSTQGTVNTGLVDGCYFIQFMFPKALHTQKWQVRR